MSLGLRPASSRLTYLSKSQGANCNTTHMLTMSIYINYISFFIGGFEIGNWK